MRRLAIPPESGGASGLQPRYGPAVSDELRRTPLHSRQQALGGRFVPFAGWHMPVQFAGVSAEHRAVRAAAGLFDVSHMGELWLSGPGACAALDYLVTRDITALEVGTAAYTVACNREGGILDDLIVYRVGAERFLVVCNASNRAKIADHFAPATAGKCDFDDRSDATALLALQGPEAPTILAALPGGAPGAGLARFGTAELSLAGLPVLVARTGYTGEDGFELFCPWNDAGALWDAVCEAGAAHRLQPIGLGARDTLRLEAAMSLYGNEIDEQCNPYEAGLGWVVKLDAGDFLGREALRTLKAERPARKLVGFRMVGRGIARHGYPILDAEGTAVGAVTSGAPGLSVDGHIGLGYVPRGLARQGTQIGIEIRGKVVEAMVVKTPFYRRAT